MTDKAPASRARERLLHQLRRWQTARWRRLRAHHWRDWAACCAERHQCVLGRGSSVAMVLARRATDFEQVRERWFFHWGSKTLRPQLHLAIQPILREISQSSNKSEFVTSFGSNSPAVAAPGQRPGLKDMATTEMTTVRATTIREFESANSTGQGGASASKSPMAVVFERLLSERSTAGLQRPVTAAKEQALSTVDRLVSKCTRIEEHVSRSTLATTSLRPREEAKGSSGPAEWTDKTDAPASGPRAIAKSGLGSGVPVNVEALAEQVLQRIDRRIVAWRERTGRK